MQNVKTIDIFSKIENYIESRTEKKRTTRREFKNDVVTLMFVLHTTQSLDDVKHKNSQDETFQRITEFTIVYLGMLENNNKHPLIQQNSDRIENVQYKCSNHC